MTTFERVKNLATHKGLSMRQVNELAGLGKGSIYHWKDKSPSINAVSKVAKVLHVSTDYLLGNTDDMSESPSIHDIDMNDVMNNETTIMRWKGKQIPPEELEMIRRILDSGN